MRNKLQEEEGEEAKYKENEFTCDLSISLSLSLPIAQSAWENS